MAWDFERLHSEFLGAVKRLQAAPVSPTVTAGEILREVEARYTFAAPRPLEEVAADVEGWLRRGNLQNLNPRCFGLFVPGATFSSAVADLLASTLNPQVGGWFHSPAAMEIEQATLNCVLRVFGFDPAAAMATFTTGGSESNLTGVLTALANRFPESRDGGVAAIPGRPVLFVSDQSHHSLWKVAQHSGLGRGAIRVVASDDRHRMRADALEEMLKVSLAAGERPFLVVATAGTTAAGAIDPLPEIADLCMRHNLWMHVDAAWGGAAMFAPGLRGFLEGMERADSIGCDAHKWMSAAMGTGMFLVRHPKALHEAFSVDTSYVPRGPEDDFYRLSIQWSRRFIGLRLFLALAHQGLAGYGAQIEHHAVMGDLLRVLLRDDGWDVANETPLPVVCFRRSGVDIPALVERVNREGNHWISVAIVKGEPLARVCISNHETAEADVRSLVSALSP